MECIISQKEITVVVQGAIVKETVDTIRSVRAVLPEATIIVSTYWGSNIDALDYDDIVFSTDPGGFKYKVDSNKLNNIERQVITTISGLRKVRTKYAIKLRSDFLLTSASFLNWFDKYNRYDEKYSLLKKRLICCDIYSRNPRLRGVQFRLAMHPSDFFFFGLTEDLIALFDMEKICDGDKIWFSMNCKNNDGFLSRYTPEQFLWIDFLRRKSTVTLPKSRMDLRKSIVIATERSFSSNLIILSKEQIGIACKRNIFLESEPGSCFSHKDWEKLYKFYCCHEILPYVSYLFSINVANMKRSMHVCVRDFSKWFYDFYFYLRKIYFQKKKTSMNDEEFIKWENQYHMRLKAIKRIFIRNFKT